MRERTRLGKGNMNYSNVGSRSSKLLDWMLAKEKKRMGDEEDFENKRISDRANDKLHTTN